MTKEEKDRRAEERTRAIQEYYRIQAERDACAGQTMLMLLVVVLILTAVVGCRSIPQPQLQEPAEKVKIIYRDSRDSIYLHDSIYIKEHIKGDTVTILEYRYRDRYRYLYDTLVVRDSVPVYVPREVVRVDHSLTWWQKVLCWAGGLALLAVAFLIYGWLTGKRKR